MKNMQRRGSIYILVLGVTTLVLTIGVGATLAARETLVIQKEMGSLIGADAAARSGLELALATLNQSPTTLTSLQERELAFPTAFGDYVVSIAVDNPDNPGTIGIATNYERLLVIALAERGEIRQYRSMIFEQVLNPQAGEPRYRMIPGSYRMMFE